MKQMRAETDLDIARAVFRAEADAVLSLAARLDDGFTRAVQLVLECEGRVVVTGMGKAGLIGQKISATFASTGTPSLFVHPAEAHHGDLGRIVGEDVVLALSNSGETEEMNRLLPSLKKIGAPLVAITSSESSVLGRAADAVLSIGDLPEADPLGLAPSSSTAAMLAMGDALVLCVLQRRGFDREQYAFYHPGGELGRRLLRVHDVMRTNERNPIVPEAVCVQDALLAITGARAGAVSVVGAGGRLAGIFTDGDLRRHLQRGGDGLLGAPIGTVMTRGPVTIAPERFATEAVRILKEKKIDELPVVDAEGRPVGMLDVQDLLGVGLV